MSHSHWDTSFTLPTLTKPGHCLTRTLVHVLEHSPKGQEAGRLLHNFGVKKTRKKQLLVPSLRVRAVFLEASAVLPGAQTGHAEHKQPCQGIQLRKLLAQDTTRKTNPKVIKSEQKHGCSCDNHSHLL